MMAIFSAQYLVCPLFVCFRSEVKNDCPTFFFVFYLYESRVENVNNKEVKKAMSGYERENYREKNTMIDKPISNYCVG